MSIDLERERRRLLRLARRRKPAYGCNKDDAEDAVQEAMFAWWRAGLRGRQWHEGRRTLELKNRIRMQRRKAKVRAHLNIPLDDEP